MTNKLQIKYKHAQNAMEVNKGVIIIYDMQSRFVENRGEAPRISIKIILDGIKAKIIGQSMDDAMMQVRVRKVFGTLRLGIGAMVPTSNVITGGARREKGRRDGARRKKMGNDRGKATKEGGKGGKEGPRSRTGLTCQFSASFLAGLARELGAIAL